MHILINRYRIIPCGTYGSNNINVQKKYLKMYEYIILKIIKFVKY